MLIGAFCTIYLPLRFRKIKVKVFFTCAVAQIMSNFVACVRILGEYLSVVEICLSRNSV